MVQMIHMVLGRSVVFSFFCFWIAGQALWSKRADLWSQHRELVWGLIGGFVLCLLLAIVGRKIAKDKRKLPSIWKFCMQMADFLSTCCWCYFCVYQVSWYPIEGIRMIYAALCFFVSLSYSENELSTIKTAIAATFISPLVIFGLLVYYSKSVVDEVEKNLLRAQRTFEDGGYEAAITSATKAIDICPETKEAEFFLSKCYYLRGKAYRHIGEFQKADNDLNEAMDLAEKRKDESFSVSVGIERCNNDLAQNPNRTNVNAYVYAKRGLLYAEKKDFERAIADCTKAIEIACGNPDDYENWETAKAYRVRRKVYLKMGDMEKAEADHAKAHELEQQD